ncbi:unnamed protein product [Orchesella dallaii]|uniref:F-box domain-containing protein n=1 Tax=Orchesella dallaii TaxID=48710 RepID=A0ABP1QY63_9HEXA
MEVTRNEYVPEQTINGVCASAVAGSSFAVQTNLQNPMANSLVVKNLFEIMPFNLNDFKNFRLVSKLWWEISLSAIRENAWLRLTDEKSEDNETPMQFYMSWLSLSNDPYQLTAERKLFTKYIISHADVCFWRQIGETMTHLKLSPVIFEDQAELYRVLTELSPKLTHLFLKDFRFVNPKMDDDQMLGHLWDEKLRHPASQINENLNYLDITVTLDCDRVSGIGQLPFNWPELLSHFPNLKVLRLYVTNRVFKKLRHGHTLQSLCDLVICYILFCMRMLRRNISEELCSELKIELLRITQGNRSSSRGVGGAGLATENRGNAVAVNMTTDHLFSNVEIFQGLANSHEVNVKSELEVESENELNFFTVDDEAFIYERVDFKATWLFEKYNFLLARQHKAVDKALNSKGGVIPIKKVNPKVTLYRKKDIVVRPPAPPIVKSKPASASAPIGGNPNHGKLWKGSSSGQPFRGTRNINKSKSSTPPAGLLSGRISTRSMDRRLRSDKSQSQLKYT